MIRKSYVKMARDFPGGLVALAAAMGRTEAATRNRIYACKGQQMTVEDALVMQSLSGTTHFAEAVAAESGGVFMALPEPDESDRGELFEKFAELYAELGELSGQMKSAVADGEIDHRERRGIAETGQDIHRILQELLQLTFAVYCRPEPEREA